MAHRQDDYLVVFRLYALSSRRPTILASIGVGLLSETPFTKQGKRILLRPGASCVPRGGRSFCAMLYHASVKCPARQSNHHREDRQGRHALRQCPDHRQLRRWIVYGPHPCRGHRIKSVGRARPK